VSTQRRRMPVGAAPNCSTDGRSTGRPDR
jgi:hypothetical protein